MNLIEQIEQTPKFQGLSYDEQIDARSRAFGQMVKENPGFANLSREDQKTAFNKLVLKPPKFSDPQMQARMQELGTGIANGDKEAVEFASKEVRLAVLGKSSLIANAVDRFLISPYLENLEAQGIQPDQVDHPDILDSPDKQKALAYMDMMLSTDQARAKKLSAQKLAIGAGATLAEFTGLTLAGAGTVRAPKALGKLFTRGAVKAMDPATSAVRSAGGFAWQGLRLGVQHAAATAMIGTAWENVQGALNELGDEDPTTRDLMLKNARWFGTYFLGDIAFNAVTDVLMPMGKSLGKNFTGWDDLSKSMIRASRGDYKNAMQSVLTGDSMDPVIWARLSKNQRELVRSRQAAVKTLKEVEGLDPTGAQRIVANQYGFGFEVKEGGSIRIWRPDGSGSKEFTTLEASGEHLRREVARLENDFAATVSAEQVGRAAASRGWATARSVLSGELKQFPSKGKLLLAQAAAPQGGKYNAGQLEAFGKLYLRFTGAGEGVQKTVGVVKAGGKYQLKVKGKNIAEVPAGQVDPKSEATITRKLLKALEPYKGRKLGDLSGVGPVLQKIQRERRMFTPGFVDHLARQGPGGPLESLGYGDRWRIGKQNFESLEDAGNWAVAQTMNFEDMAKHFSHNWGLELRRVEADGGIALREKGQVIEQARSVEDLLRELPHYRPKLPAWTGPSFGVVDGNVQLTWQQGVVAGQSTELLRFFDQFEGIELGKRITSKATGQSLELDVATKQVEVEIPDVGHRQRFGSMEEAQAFLRGWDEIEALEDMALRRGHRIDYAGGKYMVYNHEQTPTVVDNTDELKELLRSRPMPKWAPELTGASESMLRVEKSPEIRGWQNKFMGPYKSKEGWTGTEEPDLWSLTSHIDELLAPHRSHLERVVKEGGDGNLMRFYEDIRTSEDWIAGQISEQERFLRVIFSRKSGKQIPKAKRRKILQYLAADARDPKAAKRLAGELKLGREELESAEMLKQYLGETDEQGLAKFFGLSPRQFLLHYLPNAKEVARQGAKNMEMRFPDGHQGTMWQASRLTQEEASKAGAMFEYARTSDLQQLAMEEDPLRMLTTYLHQGYKSQYLKPKINQMFSYINSKGQATTRLGKEMYNYTSTLFGFPQSFSEKWLRSATKSVWKGMGLKGKVPEDISRMVMNWGYTAALGLRPALVVRNSMQIWMTLAPIVGNRGVANAVEKVAKNAVTGFKWTDPKLRAAAVEKGLFRVLEEKNVVKGSLPVFGGELYSSDSFLYKALSMYGNSDDFTRAVAWTAAKDKFDWALGRFKAAEARGKSLTEKEFYGLSGIRRMSPSAKERIIGKMRDGRWEEAGDIYAERITAESMFLYERAEGPKSFRGGIGKIFGMFGTFPVYFVDNIRRQIRYASGGEIAAFATTWLANSAALYGSFRAMGIEMNDFKPWNPLIFTGGPYYELFNKTLAAAGGDQQEFANLTGLRQRDGDIVWMPERSELLQWGIPFSLAAKDLAEGVRMAGDGNYMAAFLNSTGFNLTEPPEG